MKNHISYFYNALLNYYPLHQAWCEAKFIKYRENKLTVTGNVQNVHGTNTSTQAIDQLRHQSATARSLATQASDAVAAHQCRERDSDVIFTSRVKYISK